MRQMAAMGGAAALLLLVLGPLAAGEVSPERAKALGYLVAQDCGSCHGMTLKGGLGKPLNAANLEALEVETIAQVILDGVPGTPMPPWRGLLAEEEALWIAEALKTGAIK